MNEYKQERMQNEIHHEIRTMIVDGKINDPRIYPHLTIMHVKISKDGSQAFVFVSSFDAGKQLSKAVEALNHAHGFIQAKISKKYRWKHTPRLFFKQSDALSKGSATIKTIENLSE